MSDLRTRVIIQAQDQASKAIKDVQKSVDSLNNELSKSSKQSSSAGGILGSLGKSFAALSGPVGIAVTAISTALPIIKGFVRSVANAVGKLFGAGGQVEQLQVAFETMLGSAQQAKKVIGDLSQFAANTPFTLPGVERSAKMLLAFGFEAQQLIPLLKNIGDVASGLSLGEDGLQRLILNLGQVQAQGKLTGRELRDFAVAGVPLLDELAKSLGKTKAEIQEMVSQGQILSGDVIQAFQNMSGEGGRFENLMDKQSKTLLGLWSNLKDQVTLLSRELGVRLLPIGKLVVTTLISLVTGAVSVVKGFFKAWDAVARMFAVIIKILNPVKQQFADLITLISQLKGQMSGMTGVISFVIKAFNKVGEVIVNVAMKAVTAFINLMSKLPGVGDMFAGFGADVKATVELVKFEYNKMALAAEESSDAVVATAGIMGDVFADIPTYADGMAAGVGDATGKAEDDLLANKDAVDELNQKYWQLQVDVNQSLSKLDDEHGDTMFKLEDQMQGVRDKLAQLEADYKKSFENIGESVGDAFVRNSENIKREEERIADLQKRLSETDDANRQIDIQADIDKAQAELEKLQNARDSVIAQGFSDKFKKQIDESVRVASLTDLERALESAQKKEDELKADTEKRRAQLESELDGMEKQKIAAEQLYTLQRNQLAETKVAIQNFHQTMIDSLTGLEGATKEKVSAMNNKLTELKNILQSVKDTAAAIIRERNSIDGATFTSSTVAPIGSPSNSTTNNSTQSISINLGGVSVNNQADENRLAQKIKEVVGNAITNVRTNA